MAMVSEPGRQTPVVAETDVLVVGGGPAGQAAAVAGAFDPEGWKQVSQEMVLEAGAKLRFHSWFSRAIVEDGAVRGVVVETKSGRQAILGRVVIDASGDGDVFASAGAPGVHGSYIMTLVHRLADVDTDEAIAFERADPAAAQQLDREVKQLLGGSWTMWWLLTPRPGVVWCNCPHIPGHDGLDPEHQTKIEIEARRRFMKVAEFVRAHYPGLQRAYILDAAPQLGVRQTRLLEGEYVVTKEDILERRTFPDVVARGRDYYPPYRSRVPNGIEGLLVAGRCYSATSEAQRISREIPPLMVMGEAAGTAAALSLESSVAPRKVDVSGLQKRLVAQGVNLGTR